MVEAIASNDEALMEKYFDKGELDEDEMKEGMKKAMINHDIFPLFCLSGLRNMGSGRLMGFIDNVCPSACDMPAQKTIKGEELANIHRKIIASEKDLAGDASPQNDPPEHRPNGHYHTSPP